MPFPSAPPPPKKNKDKTYVCVLKQEINKENDNVLLKNPPFRCRRQDCQFITDNRSGFFLHMGKTHRLVDEQLKEFTKTIVQGDETTDSAGNEFRNMFAGKCSVCDEDLKSTATPEGLRAAKVHYHIHFKAGPYVNY